MPSVVRLSDVSVVRDGSTILDGISWEVQDDERWVVLGANGAGKTTLLQVAGAQTFPTSGDVEVLGTALGGADLFELRPPDRLRVDRPGASHPDDREGHRRGPDRCVLGHRPVERGVRGARRPPCPARARGVGPRCLHRAQLRGSSATASRSGSRSPVR
ncbi:ATP-binding cassette domain-containing protein [Curtobacterium sp. MCPF17_052]|nr:ATP-binding cassette domain-containing protein [Curtobacterium sp. MCPF17_052]WIB12732.1 ATP-binding cassette domain-containing protein [Curtobacterium sp. MCPF17_052]